MIVEKTSLRKILRIFQANEKQKSSLIRRDISETLRREKGSKSSGGDFYGPFWADAKVYARGGLNLAEAAALRVAKNGRRRGLYPLLADGFIRLVRDNRRFINEPYEIPDDSPSGQVIIGKERSVVTVGNNLLIRIGDGSERIVYPYWFSSPALEGDIARLGIWAIGSALGLESADQIRLIDILRGAVFSTETHPLVGNEEQSFSERYDAVCNSWYRLRADRKS